MVREKYIETMCISRLAYNFTAHTVKNEWGNTISCQTWYSGGSEEAAGSDNTKSALGGFPGQPLVFDDGDYYMQIPKALPANYSTAINGSKVTVQGMTLSNYYWDDVHRALADKDNAFKGKNNARSGSEANSQTYDYNDFAALAAMGADDIIFTFKYRSSIDNRTINTPPTIDVGWSENYWNGWDGLVDYYNRAVDLSGNFITNANGEPYTEEDLLKTYTANADEAAAQPDKFTADSKLDPDNKIWIVSKGYQSIKDNNSGYYGNYATIWEVYTYDSSTSGFTSIGSLPSSSFIPPSQAYELNDKGEIIENDANKAKYLSFSTDDGVDTYH